MPPSVRRFELWSLRPSKSVRSALPGAGPASALRTHSGKACETSRAVEVKPCPPCSSRSRRIGNLPTCRPPSAYSCFDIIAMSLIAGMDCLFRWGSTLPVRPRVPARVLADRTAAARAIEAAPERPPALPSKSNNLRTHDAFPQGKSILIQFHKSRVKKWRRNKRSTS